MSPTDEWLSCSVNAARLTSSRVAPLCSPGNEYRNIARAARTAVSPSRTAPDCFEVMSRLITDSMFSPVCATSSFRMSSTRRSISDSVMYGLSDSSSECTTLDSSLRAPRVRWNFG